MNELFHITNYDERLFRRYEEYDPDKDISGFEGHAIIDELYIRFRDFNKIKLWHVLMRLRHHCLETDSNSEKQIVIN